MDRGSSPFPSDLLIPRAPARHTLSGHAHILKSHLPAKEEKREIPTRNFLPAPSQIKMMATTLLQLDRSFDPTLTLSNLVSSLSLNVILCAYYTSQIQQLVMRGIVECLVQNKEELVEAADDDDDDDEEEDFEEEEEEEEEGEEEEEEEEGDGGDEPPAKRRKKDEDDDKKKKKDEGEEKEDEEEVCLRSVTKLTCSRKVKREKKRKRRKSMTKRTTTTKKSMKTYHLTIVQY